MSTRGESGLGLKPGSDIICHQIASGFEDLADRLQCAIDSLPHGDPEIAALARVREKALHAGVRVREAMGGND